MKNLPNWRPLKPNLAFYFCCLFFLTISVVFGSKVGRRIVSQDFQNTSKVKYSDTFEVGHAAQGDILPFFGERKVLEVSGETFEFPGNVKVTGYLDLAGSATAPTAAAGRIYYDTDDYKTYFYNNSTWTEMGGTSLWTDAVGYINPTNATGFQIADTSGDTTVPGNLTVSGAGTHAFGGTIDPTNVTAFTLTGAIAGSSSPAITGLGQVTVDSLRLDGSTLDTTTGFLTLDSDGGVVYLNDNIATTGNISKAANSLYVSAAGAGADIVLQTGGTDKFKVLSDGKLWQTGPGCGGIMPEGMIAMFDGACPSGWTEVTSFQNKLAVGHDADGIYCETDQDICRRWFCYTVSGGSWSCDCYFCGGCQGYCSICGEVGGEDGPPDPVYSCSSCKPSSPYTPLICTYLRTDDLSCHCFEWVSPCALVGSTRYGSCNVLVCDTKVIQCSSVPFREVVFCQKD